MNTLEEIAEAPQAPVAQWMGELSHTIMVSGDLDKEINTRLSPCLSSPSPESPPNENPEGELCALANALRDLTRQVRDQNDRKRELLDRIEL